jgi:(2R)-3-sulfolactate dehydrogenase (NADP+)
MEPIVTVNLSLAELTRLIATALQRSNVAPDIAQSVAAALTRAEADGVTSHGAARTPPYCEQALCGKADGHARPTLERSAAAVINVDSHIGFAFPAIRMGLDAACEAVRETGIVALGIAHSHHFGVAGHHVEDLAEHGLVGIAFANTPASIAPWGGARAIYGTNPIAFAWPRQGRSPMVVDLSVSAVARGKVVLAHQRGETIPDDWAMDATGQPTIIPAEGMAGSMTPLGGTTAGAKGAALALMIELLCGALTGSNFGYEGTSFFEPQGTPPSIGHLILVIDPKAFGGAASFLPRAEELFSEILAEPNTRLPGDRRLVLREKAAVHGVEISDELYADICRRTRAQ